MSQFYRCDGCGAEADHPGVDYRMDEPHLPEGWKTGPKGDFCPKHPMRIANGASLFIAYSPGYKGTGEEYATVRGYSVSRGRYTLEIFPDDAKGFELKRITRSADEIHAGTERLRTSVESIQWVPL